jgi:hypothetical protein
VPLEKGRYKLFPEDHILAILASPNVDNLCELANIQVLGNIRGTYLDTYRCLDELDIFPSLRGQIRPSPRALGGTLPALEVDVFNRAIFEL